MLNSKCPFLLFVLTYTFWCILDISPPFFLFQKLKKGIKIRCIQTLSRILLKGRWGSSLGICGGTMVSNRRVGYWRFGKAKASVSRPSSSCLCPGHSAFCSRVFYLDTRHSHWKAQRKCESWTHELWQGYPESHVTNNGGQCQVTITQQWAQMGPPLRERPGIVLWYFQDLCTVAHDFGKSEAWWLLVPPSGFTKLC